MTSSNTDSPTRPDGAWAVKAAGPSRRCVQHDPNAISGEAPTLAPDSLRRLQKTQLRIAADVADLCDRNGISYVLLGGSALGARRHNGFIPWDDDMDLGMLRADFERFLQAARRELPQCYYVQHWVDDPYMGAAFAKVRLNDTRIVESASAQVGGHKGIAIDIFPFDSVPSGVAKYWWQIELRLWKRVLHHQTGYRRRAMPVHYALADLPITVLARSVTMGFSKRRLRWLGQRYEAVKTEHVLAIGGAYSFKKDTLKRSWLLDRSLKQFEDCLFFCPAQIDEYLGHVYGDFMSLPPVEEQTNKHSIIALSFRAENYA